MTSRSERLRVALTMLTLVPGGMGGSETYARALTGALVGRERLDARVYVSESGAGISEGIPETVVHGVGGGASTRARLTTLATGTIRRGSLVKLLEPVDVVHAPLSVPLPRPPRGTAFVQTLLDVQHLELPGLFTASERQYRHWLYDRTAQRADAVITISEHAKREIISRLSVEADRVFVAHLGVDTTRYRPSTQDREGFVFYPARGWPHKNHARLIEAMSLLRQSRPDLRLVLTGGGLDSLGPVPEWVEPRGLVSNEDLTTLYATAGALAFPSRYEGFGLPPLEAMASGCPVAASTAGSIPEICGDAAFFFDPDDVDGMATSIASALDSEGAMLEAGLARVRAFTWESCAAVHESAYRFAHEHRRPA